ncbi:pilus assembly protein PilY [Pseudomonas sp. RL_15y_Pfl2_60]|uniref:pilus assembly protein PilY n=1 Tax=Pseudomonas sp. RL_15y_Pfl2_60 TaxID=3088709 RepID=UPI0030DD4192
MSLTRKLAIGASAFTYLALSLSTALADDTEIYTTRDLPADQRVRPNILFVIDTSGSMQNGVPGTDCKSLEPLENSSRGMPRNWCTSTEGRNNRTNNGQLTRIQVVKQVVNQLVDELAITNDSNIGLARFSSDDEGGFINNPVQQASMVANSFKSNLSSYYASGSTPLLESYHEAVQYMRGSSLIYGNSSRGVYEDETGSRTRNPWNSDNGSRSGNTYTSPITNSCQKSNIIVLTDGLPNNDSSSNNTISSLTRTGKSNTQYTSCNQNYPTDGERNAGCWMPGLAEWMANNDSGPASLAGTQTVSTYTIGFGNISDTRLLEDTATLGQGKFFVTSDTSGLVSSLKSIVTDILAENTTFTTPTVSVSAYSNFGYRNDLYYALFRPAKGARWVGNVKKYKATTTVDGDLIVTDSRGLNAIDSSTGFFSDSAQSFWSPSADGKNAEAGGAASRLPNPATRVIYTYTGTNIEPSANPAPVNLASGNDNKLVTNNAAVTKALLGSASMTDTQRSNIITWARGTNPADNSNRYQIGDILHNTPKVVAYTSDEDLTRANTNNSQDKLALFYGTNEGFIGAINPDTGAEYFSFIPKELLGNLKAYYEDPQGSVNKKYGMDGQFDLNVSYGDVNQSTKLRTVTAVNLYAGMGRGGRNYYSLDVTPSTAGNPSSISPKLKWVIRGGASTGFARLGQTWSTPKVAKVNWNGTATDVLIFTGGYDPIQDNDTTPDLPKTDTYGNALYVVNAATGQKLWMAGPSGDTDANLKLATMTNSMPADPTLVDLGGDGLIDTIFTSDTRGQIFRFDIKSNNTGAGNFATGGRIANIAGTDQLNNRRFYNKPDVSLIKERGGKTYYTISIGSGYRGHPLSEATVDRFYMIKDANVYAAPATYTSITESNLTDVSSVNLSSSQAAEVQSNINDVRAEIDALTASETAARENFSNYQSSIGYTAKAEELLAANASINQKQSAIDAILTNDPYVTAHADEASQQTQLHSLTVVAQDGLKQVTELQPTTAEASAFKAAQLQNDDATDWGALQARITALANSPVQENDYNAITAKEQEIIAAREVDADTTALEAELDSLNDNYQSSADVTARAGIVDQISEINTAMAEVKSLQLETFNAYNSSDTATGDAKKAQLASKQAELETLLAGLPPAPGGIDNAELLAATTAADQTALEGVSSPLETQAALLQTLQTERLALAGVASGLQADIQALADRAYDPSSNLLTATELADATAKDADAPLTMFDAHNYLINKAQAEAAAQIPGKRTEINDLYAQLTPGDEYTPDPTTLANSSGWFIRFPAGEKVLANSVTFAGAVLFTTFRPNGSQVTTCGPDVGSGRFYALNITDASAVFTQNISGTKTPKRSFDLTHGGIPSSPAPIVSDDNPVGLLCGAEGCIKDEDNVECAEGQKICEIKNPIRGLYWREN